MKRYRAITIEIVFCVTLGILLPLTAMCVAWKIIVPRADLLCRPYVSVNCHKLTTPVSGSQLIVVPTRTYNSSYTQPKATKERKKKYNYNKSIVSITANWSNQNKEERALIMTLLPSSIPCLSKYNCPKRGRAGSSSKLPWKEVDSYNGPINN